MEKKFFLLSVHISAPRHFKTAKNLQRVMTAIASIGEIQEFLKFETLLRPALTRGGVLVVWRLLVNGRPEVGGDVINSGIDAIPV